MLILPVFYLGLPYMRSLVDVYLSTEFDGVASHAESNRKVKEIEAEFNKCT